MKCNHHHHDHGSHSDTGHQDETVSDGDQSIDRRGFLKTGAAMGAAGAAIAAGTVGLGGAEANAAADPYADPAKAFLPKTDVKVGLKNTALVITDPQIDFLSPKGVTWGAVGKSVTANGTVGNIGRLLDAAKLVGMTVAISPHWYYPQDHEWDFGNPLEKLMHAIKMFDRKEYLNVDGFETSGADFMPEYKKHILDGKTIIASPHKVFGPEQNDLALQLRKKGVDRVILAGMSANLCVQAHLHELLEQGFQVAVVRDATAAAQIPEGDGYLAAIINFRFIANGLWTTDDAVKRIKAVA